MIRSSYIAPNGLRVNDNDDPVCEHCGDPRTDYVMGLWLCPECEEERFGAQLWDDYLDELASTFEEPA